MNYIVCYILSTNDRPARKLKKEKRKTGVSAIALVKEPHNFFLKNGFVF
jgi:hypothetical protein